jgi:hypothetical protein
MSVCIYPVPPIADESWPSYNPIRDEIVVSRNYCLVNHSAHQLDINKSELL